MENSAKEARAPVRTDAERNDPIPSRKSRSRRRSKRLVGSKGHGVPEPSDIGGEPSRQDRSQVTPGAHHRSHGGRHDSRGSSEAGPGSSAPTLQGHRGIFPKGRMAHCSPPRTYPADGSSPDKRGREAMGSQSRASSSKAPRVPEQSDKSQIGIRQRARSSGGRARESVKIPPKRERVSPISPEEKESRKRVRVRFHENRGRQERDEGTGLRKTEEKEEKVIDLVAAEDVKKKDGQKEEAEKGHGERERHDRKGNRRNWNQGRWRWKPKGRGKRGKAGRGQGDGPGKGRSSESRTVQMK